MTERRSDKHGPKLDEELEAETDSITRGAPVESRAHERREQEGPAEGEPTPDARVTGTRAGTSGDIIDLDALALRADIARFLDPSVFPAEREALVNSARQNDAPDPIVNLLTTLPDGFYENAQVVWEGLKRGSRQEA